MLYITCFTGKFGLNVSVDSLFFIGSQLVALSQTGKVGVWHAMTQHWQVRGANSVCIRPLTVQYWLLTTPIEYNAYIWTPDIFFSPKCIYSMIFQKMHNAYLLKSMHISANTPLIWSSACMCPCTSWISVPFTDVICRSKMLFQFPAMIRQALFCFWDVRMVPYII